MLNSKYAPIFALTALGIIAVVLLGWFLAIKPQVDEASAFASDEDLVRANIATVQADEASIEAFDSALGEAPDIKPTLELNAPQRLDLEGFRNRISDAISESGVEIAASGQEYGSLVAGWEIPAVLLDSTRAAKYFQSGPAPTTKIAAEAFTPVVSVPSGEQVRAEGLAAIPFEFTVVGTPQEAYDFLSRLQDPSVQFFQVGEIDVLGLVDGEVVAGGVSEAGDGDVRLEISGGLYLSEIDTSSIDEGALGTAEVSGDSPFIRLEDDAPEQEGAN
ncbi:hypothetical protein ON058_06445 [Demequina sp. B12]|uniref:hypothetical protein n=1 Tax=Demequina sp. B12 TaxID=2992757 RepID=UPI00237B81C6|nr:hypothetical protein [Demequina sp. B12]MDE0573049.1 hypothetical protein [Demequina sp. B12]